MKKYRLRLDITVKTKRKIWKIVKAYAKTNPEMFDEAIKTKIVQALGEDWQTLVLPVTTVRAP